MHQLDQRWRLSSLRERSFVLPASSAPRAVQAARDGAHISPTSDGGPPVRLQRISRVVGAMDLLRERQDCWAATAGRVRQRRGRRRCCGWRATERPGGPSALRRRSEPGAGRTPITLPKVSTWAPCECKDRPPSPRSRRFAGTQRLEGQSRPRVSQVQQRHWQAGQEPGPSTTRSCHSDRRSC